MRIHNEALRVEYDEAAARFSVSSKGNGRAFAADGRLGGEGGTAKIVLIADKSFGEGQAIEIAAPNGSRDWIMLFPGVPFVLFQTSLRNNGQEPARVDRLRSVSAALDLGKEAARLRAFGTAGLTAPDQNPGSYAYLAVVDPETRSGAVAGRPAGPPPPSISAGRPPTSARSARAGSLPLTRTPVATRGWPWPIP